MTRARLEVDELPTMASEQTNENPSAKGPESRSEAIVGESSAAGIRGYFRALASGTEPLHRVIVSDMLIAGR